MPGTRELLPFLGHFFFHLAHCRREHRETLLGFRTLHACELPQFCDVAPLVSGVVDRGLEQKRSAGYTFGRHSAKSWMAQNPLERLLANFSLADVFVAVGLSAPRGLGGIYGGEPDNC